MTAKQLERCVQAHLRGQEPPWGVHSLSVLLDDVTSSVREHITLEREITNYWLAKYFQTETAADPSRTWSALLLHWIRQVCYHQHPHKNSMLFCAFLSVEAAWFHL